MCAACPTPRLNESYELRPPWEQHLRYVPHRVHNGYNTRTIRILILYSAKLQYTPQKGKYNKIHMKMEAEQNVMYNTYMLVDSQV